MSEKIKEDGRYVSGFDVNRFRWEHPNLSTSEIDIYRLYALPSIIEDFNITMPLSWTIARLVGDMDTSKLKENSPFRGWRNITVNYRSTSYSGSNEALELRVWERINDLIKLEVIDQGADVSWTEVSWSSTDDSSTGDQKRGTIDYRHTHEVRVTWSTTFKTRQAREQERAQALLEEKKNRKEAAWAHVAHLASIGK